MDYLTLLYPLLFFVFIRVAIYCFAKWAVRGRLIELIAGVVSMAFAFDSGWNLIKIALLAPYRWLLPLVLFAMAYVIFRVFRKTLRGMSGHKVLVESADH